MLQGPRKLLNLCQFWLVRSYLFRRLPPDKDSAKPAESGSSPPPRVFSTVENPTFLVPCRMLGAKDYNSIPRTVAIAGNEPSTSFPSTTTAGAETAPCCSANASIHSG